MTSKNPWITWTSVSFVWPGRERKLNKRTLRQIRQACAIEHDWRPVTHDLAKGAPMMECTRPTCEAVGWLVPKDSE